MAVEASNWARATISKQMIDAIRDIMIRYYMMHGRWPSVNEIESMLGGARAL